MISAQLDNHVLTLAFARADKMNAITNQMYLDAAKALNDAAEQPDVRVVIFTGEGGNLTCGNDLVDFVNNPPNGPMPPVLEFLLSLARFPKPIVVAINGLAVGIGTTMLAHCDYVVAADDTRFKLPFVDLGACPEGGSSLLFPQIMGHSQAAELLLLADIFGAEKAQHVGLVNQVVAADEVMAHAQKIAAKMASKPPSAMRLTKAMLKQGYMEQLEKRLADEIYKFRELLDSPEAQEALTAFTERRKPDFSRFS